MKKKYLLRTLVIFGFHFSTVNLFAGDGVKSYMDAWKETNRNTRIALIRSCWTDLSRYEDPLASATGADSLNAVIEKFQKDFPGASLSNDTVLATGNHRSWNWSIFTADHKLLVRGRDIALLNKDGRILTLTGFFDPPDNPALPNKSVEEKTAAKYFECLFRTRDFTTMQNIVAKEAMYYQAVGLPYGGTYKGFSEWVIMFTKAQGYFDLSIEGEPVYYSNAQNGTVFIYFWIHCKSKKSGKEISMPVAEYYEVKNGLITEIRPYYFDTATFTAFLN